MGLSTRISILNASELFRVKFAQWVEELPISVELTYHPQSDLYDGLSGLKDCEALIYHAKTEEDVELLLRTLRQYRSILSYLPILVIGPNIEISVVLDLVEHGVSNYLTEEELTASLFLRQFLAIHRLVKRVHNHKQQTEMEKTRSFRADHANRSKSEFIAMTSHELRTPLNAIMGFSQMMQAETFGKLGHEKYYEYASDIYQSGSYLLDLIRDVMDLSKVEGGHAQIEESYYEPHGLIAGALNLVMPKIEEKGITLLRDVQLGNHYLYVDKIGFTQILVNFLTNSLKFTPSHGSITVSARLIASGEFEVSVADTGSGISPEDLQKVMSAYYQANRHSNKLEEGAGLGLAIVKGLAEVHQGRVWLESEVGVGTKAILRLPANRVKSEEAEIAPWHVQLLGRGA